MNTINYYARLTDALSVMNLNIESLEYQFSQEAPRTQLDEDLIDALLVAADQMRAAAEALKTVDYSPSMEQAG